VQPAPTIRVHVAWGDRSRSILLSPGQSAVIGRDTSSTVCVPVATVSRQHVKIDCDGHEWRVTDLDSRAGTRRQGLPLPAKAPVALFDGDQLSLGPGVMAVIEITAPAGATMLRTLDDSGESPARIAAANPAELLEHVLKASRSIGQASTERDVWLNAARALAEARGLGIATAAAVQAKDAARITVLAHHGNQDATFSRRAIEQSLRTPDETAIFERSAEGSVGATLMSDSEFVACHATTLASDDGTNLLYAEGRHSLGSARTHFAHFVGIVAQLASQAVMQLRRARFSRYVSPSIAALLAREGTDTLEQIPQWHQASCLFLDMQGFSSLVDVPNDQVGAVHQRMRGYMDELTKAIFDEQGMVVEFTGDGVFAAFGVPTSHDDHIAASIRAALVAKRIVPDSRLGLDAGACLFGPMGARLHAKLGLFGTVVNRASRLEQLGRAERMEAGILCTRAIAADAGAQGAAQFLRVGMVVPKGLQDAVEVFEAVPHGTLPPEQANTLTALSLQLEEARDTMALLAVAHSAQQLAGVHRRFAWLARTSTTMLQNPGAWDGLHRPGK